MPYSFRDVRPDDMPLLRVWLRTPEVVRWWGDPDEQAAMLEEDLTEPGMVIRIVSLFEKPFAYAQDYAVDRWPQAHFAGLPPGSRAIDSFIGEPELIGRGHGSAYLRLLATRLRADGALWSRSIPTLTTCAPGAPTKRPDLSETGSFRPPTASRY